MNDEHINQIINIVDQIIDQSICPDCEHPVCLDKRKAAIKHVSFIEQEAIKRGFYAGQAMAGVELDDCHDNWKKWNTWGDDEL